MLERGGRVRTRIVKKDDLTAKKLAALVRQNVDVENATLHTDEYKGYRLADLHAHSPPGVFVDFKVAS